MAASDWVRHRVDDAITVARQLGVGRLLLTILFIVMAVLLARFSWNLPLAIDAERALYDWRHVMTAQKVDQDDRIVMVVYTDETLAATGKRSPLDRTVLAKALRRLDGFGARSIGIDILIDQPQPEDAELIAAFQAMKTPTHLAYASAVTAEDKIKPWQQEFLDKLHSMIVPGNVRKTSIVIEADDDNVLRSWPEVRPNEPKRMATAMTAQRASGFDTYQGSVVYRVPRYVERPVFATIPIDTFAEDAIFANPDAAELFRQQISGKYVLVGGHIQDIDLFETPLNKLTGKPTWGVEVFAHMVAQQLDNILPLQIPGWVHWIAACAVVAAATTTAASNTRPLFLGLAIIAQFGAITLIPFVAQSRAIDTQQLSAFGWLAGWVLTFAAAGTAARAIGSEQRRYAQNALGRYLPRDIAAEILRNPESLALQGEKREIFVVFTDLEGFTKLSHAIEPEMVATLLNRYLDMLSDVVLKHGGTIDKFVGDAVVAFWGAPISRPDDGERAARAAVAMHEAGENFRRSVPDGVPAIGKTRVGLHFGDAIVGNFGGEGRIQYTALGDSMNTAARLEAANKQTHSSVLVSREAVERADLNWYRPLGRVVLRGRSTPVEIFEPVPNMLSEDRQAFVALANRAIRGDVSAITSLAEESDKAPGDKALASFVYRLGHQEKGGYFVLD